MLKGKEFTPAHKAASPRIKTDQAPWPQMQAIYWERPRLAAYQKIILRGDHKLQAWTSLQSWRTRRGDDAWERRHPGGISGGDLNHRQTGSWRSVLGLPLTDPKA